MGSYNRQIKAQEHIEDMFDNYSVPIKYSIDNSKVYSNIVKDFVYENKGNVPEIVMEKMNTDTAIHKYGTGCTALNFASYKYPGGGFVKGSMAQEEALCHASFLYNVLSDKRFAAYYAYNRNHLNIGLYNNCGFYTPAIMFEDRDNKTWANIITVAAPNYGRYCEMSKDDKTILNRKFNDVLESRLKFVLDIAEVNNTKTLILGAFGCGVFKNNPSIVASYFKTLLETGNYNFETVVFAIPDDKNYNEFNKIFNYEKNN